LVDVQPGALTRAEIADSIRAHIGTTRRDAEVLVDSILTNMGDALARGKNVKISNFGTFVLNDKPERIGRNPKNGAEHTITARRVVTFRPS
jgi:integration host factor subunit alpha